MPTLAPIMRCTMSAWRWRQLLVDVDQQTQEARGQLQHGLVGVEGDDERGLHCAVAHAAISLLLQRAVRLRGVLVAERLAFATPTIKAP